MVDMQMFEGGHLSSRSAPFFKEVDAEGASDCSGSLEREDMEIGGRF